MDNLEFEKQYQEKGFFSQRRYPNEHLIQFLAQNYFRFPREERKAIKILELGCGSGANLWMIAKEGFHSYGVDIAQTGLQLCREMLGYWGVTKELPAELFLAKMEKLPFDDNFFDAIVDVVSMQHLDIPGHLASYKEAWRCLKPNGRFFQWHLGAGSISFINGKGKKIDKLTIDNIANSDVPLYNNGRTSFLTPTDAEEMIALAGFSNIKIELVTRTYSGMIQTIEYLAIQAEK